MSEFKIDDFIDGLKDKVMAGFIPEQVILHTCMFYSLRKHYQGLNFITRLKNAGKRRLL